MVSHTLNNSASESRLENPTETIQQGQQAWARLSANNTWADWAAVGRALLIGRAAAAHEAGTDKGRKFDLAFAAWRQGHGFGQLDKGDQHRLLKVMDRLQEIEAWRGGLTTTERLKLNHPSYVLRKFTASTVLPKQDNGIKKPTKLQLTEGELQKMIDENDRLRHSGDLWTAEDRPENIAKVMYAQLGPSKFDRLIEAMQKLAKKRLNKPAPTHRETHVN
jgi:hypothetical protein